MYSLTVNGVLHQVDDDKKLMRFLRDDLKLISVKDGCSEGACGTCTVIIDGKATRACVSTLSRLDGKSIITVEGLSDREKEVYSNAFAQAGAVQCGFCIPGMVMSAKALIDKNPAPTRLEAIAAIKSNICRCTGYKKIVDGILLAAELLSTAEDIPANDPSTRIGRRMKRIDAIEKTLGKGEYPDDIHLEGMIYGSAIRSAHPRARVLAIDAKAAKALPGVIGVFTAADIPEGGSYKVGHLKPDWDALVPVGEITHTLGDAICLVAAETPEIVEAAKALVNIEYEELPGVFDPVEALEPDAPEVHEGTGTNVLAHEHLVRGDADAVIEASAHKVSYHYETPWTEHAFLEPECAVAMPFDGDGVFIWSTDQGIYDTQHECMMLLGLPAEKVIIENKLVGGGFGGKEDVSVQHHAALIAYLTKRIVKVRLSRKESLLIHPKRHPFIMDVTSACDENGLLTAFKAVVISDTGAYASLGGPVLQRACTHAAGPYNFQTIDIDGTAVYTNNPPAGAFRGFGVTQTNFASEMNLNALAEKVGISPWEIRYRNAIRPGQVLPNGQIADPSTGLAETLEAVKPYVENHPRAGVACAMKNAGVGVGLPDWGRCRLQINNGKVEIYAGASCIGQGLGTVLVQMLCEITDLPLERVTYMPPNTSNCPDSGTTSGSRQTLVTGEACRLAALKLKDALADKSLDALEGVEFEGEYLAKTDAMGSDVTNPVSHVAYGYATQACLLAEDGTVEELVAAHEVGRAINPINVEGQIEGGVVMGMGFALTERYALENGMPKSKFGTLGLFKADKVPELTPLIVEKPGIEVAFGAIGIGEITSIPTAAAIAGAYYKHSGEFQTKLPLVNTPYEKKAKK